MYRAEGSRSAQHTIGDFVPMSGHVAFAGYVECRRPHLCACPGRNQFPVAINVAVPVEAAPEARPHELACVELDVLLGNPRREDSGAGLPLKIPPIRGAMPTSPPPIRGCGRSELPEPQKRTRRTPFRCRGFGNSYNLGNLLGFHMGLQCPIRRYTASPPWLCSAECSWF
jgi:hypothetical protein